MNIEKSIEEIKIQDLIEHIRFGTQLKYDIKDYIYSIEILLTAYEKEKEMNKRLRKCHYQYEEKKAIEFIKSELEDEKKARDDYQSLTGLYGNLEIEILLNLIEKQSKEIEELKASHIITNNKATDTEKAKIFDVIENSIDTYIEKSKPYWEQIMTKDEMAIDEALTIIDDMYQDRFKIMSQKTEKETIVDLSKMDYIKFTNLEWASVRALREVQSLNHKLEKMKDKIKAKIEELDKEEKEALKGTKGQDRYAIKQEYMYKRSGLQSLLEKE